MKTTKIILAALLTSGLTNAAFAQTTTGGTMGTTTGTTTGTMGTTTGTMGTTTGTMGTSTSGSMGTTSGTTSGSSTSGRRMKTKSTMPNGKGKMKGKSTM